jgi:zinc transport system substrate-binding protein
MKSILALSLVLCLALPAFSFAEGARQATVVASFYPIYIFAANLLKDMENIRLVSLTAPSTGCLHNYQLLASDMRTLATADAFCINGAGMETYLGKLSEQFPSLPVIEGASGIELIYDQESKTYNPHVWLDVKNAIRMVLNLSEGLRAILPGQEEHIKANADLYIHMLTGLDAEIKDGLEGIANRDIVTFHEAFPYFAKAYGLRVAAVIALEPDDALSPQMISDIIDKVRSSGNPPLFTEPQYTSAAARVISEATGAAVYELDPVVTGNGALSAYEDTMRSNLLVLQGALSSK